MRRALTERHISRSAFTARSVAALSTFAIIPGKARAAQFAWKYGSTNTPEQPANAAVVRAFARIRDETHGALDITPFYSGSLGSENAMLAQIRLGALEMMSMAGLSLDIIVPLASIEGVAYAFPDRRAIFNAMDGDLGKMVRNELPTRGIIAMERIWENGYRYMTSGAKPIRTPDDLQGMKFRVPTGKLFLDTMSSLGVIAANIPVNQVYIALQTHLVDAQETPLATIEEMRFYEVQKYLALTRHIWGGYWMIFSREKWESLPRNVQEVVRKHVNAAAIAERQASENIQQSLRTQLQSQGLTINDVDTSSFKAKLAASGYYTRWRNEYGATGWAALEKYAGPLR